MSANNEIVDGIAQRAVVDDTTATAVDATPSVEGTVKPDSEEKPIEEEKEDTTELKETSELKEEDIQLADVSVDNDTSSQIKSELEATEAAETSIDEVEEKEDYSDSVFQPATLVLAKVKGYSAWPAMVLEETILPENIKRKKPKKSTKRKLTRFMPVRFFSDDTYIWMNELDLKLLTPELIAEYFEVASRKRRRDTLLEKAYQLALDPPNMEVFASLGSKEEDENDVDGDLYMDDIDEYLGEESQKKRGRKAKVDLKADALNNLKQLKKMELLKKKSEAEKLEASLLAEYDDDWGVDGIDGYDYASGNYVFKDDKIELDSVELGKSLAKFQQKFNFYYNKLLNQLINTEVNAEETEKTLGHLQIVLSNKQFPKTILTKSKLLRLLILTLRKPDEKFPYPTVKQKISDILRKSLNLTITQVALEKENEQVPLEKIDESITSEKVDEPVTLEKANDSVPVVNETKS